VLRRLIATQFVRVMESGRTGPILCGCADQDGNDAGDFVVKLRQRMSTGVRGLLHEFLGSRLASHFGIMVPEPVGVSIEPEFAEALADRDALLAASLQASIGLNFGSRILNPVSIWLVNRLIPAAMWRDAVNIFALDALMQNPDRRTDNPNVLTQDDNIFVYDHEASFSFLFAVVKSDEPWNIEREMYLANHVFYKRLKGKEIDLKDFEERLNALSPGPWAEIRDEIPDEWHHADFDEIEMHLRGVRDHAGEFVQQVRRWLR
jgi:hypothetical protein